MKNQDRKKEQKRGNSIDEAISPPFPQVQCISFAPETQLQGAGVKSVSTEKSEARP